MMPGTTSSKLHRNTNSPCRIASHNTRKKRPNPSKRLPISAVSSRLTCSEKITKPTLTI